MPRKSPSTIKSEVDSQIINKNYTTGQEAGDRLKDIVDSVAKIGTSSSTEFVRGDSSTESTRATAVDGAIGRAGNNGKQFVYVPQEFLDYDAASVDFDKNGFAGLVIREGNQSLVADIKAFGASVDGTKDDVSSWNAAIKKGNELDIAIYHPGGTSLTSTITEGYDGLSFLGSGMNDSNITSMAGNTVFDFTGMPGTPKYISWQELAILGNSKSGPGDGIHFSKGFHIYLEKVKLLNFGGSGFYCSGDFFSSRFKDCRVGACNGAGIEVDGGPAVQYTRIDISNVPAGAKGIWQKDGYATFEGISTYPTQSGISVKLGGNARCGASFIGCNFEHIQGVSVNQDVSSRHGIYFENCTWRSGGGATDAVALEYDADTTTDERIIFGPACEIVNGNNSSWKDGYSIHSTGGTDNPPLSYTRSVPDKAYDDGSGFEFNMPKIFTTNQAGGFNVNAVHIGGAKITNRFGVFKNAVAQQSALTSPNSSTVDGTYGTEERDVIQNLRTRVNELESRLEAYGLLP